ncbi:MAG: hydrogenase maturation nickel metallochaperone HypA [Bacteroidales bacterium]|nr:hydrogenase maturation nickel metallochaperone HypA [Bacteroidales bacterium]
MHELAMVQNMFRIILEVADQNQLQKITRVNFEVGKMQQIVPEYFEFAFEATKENTIASEAQLSLSFIPITLKCKACNHEFTIADGAFICPKCQETDLELISGNELLIKSIEGD